MGMEVAGSDMAQVNVGTMVEESKSKLHEKENGEVVLEQDVSEPIKFGSYGVDEPNKGGVTNLSNDDMPKNATDEWPELQNHYFYFPRWRQYDDPILKAKFEQADMDFKRKKQQITQIIGALQDKRSVRSGVIAQLKFLTAEKKHYNIAMDEKRNVMKPLQEALGSLRGSNNPGREKGVGVCSSEEELNELIQSLHYRMQHESISLTEEKQLLREIKQLEGTREQVIANAAMRAKIQDSLGQRETIQEQVKLIGSDLDGVRKERETVRAKIKDLEDELKAVDKDIAALQEELRIVDEKKGNAAENLNQLWKKIIDGNACFDQYRNLLSKAKELALRKDIKALEELYHGEVEKFMSHWNSSKAFRDDYEKRILLSLDFRQLSRDGRMRNPDEKPLVLVETSRPTEIETVSKPSPKPPKEDVKHSVQQDNLPLQRVQKESKKKAAESKTASEHHAMEEETFVIEKPQKDTSKDREIDPAKLKEMKREEEMTKQRQALERKKKLAEKAAAKAAARAQKEAEKKQKEREKKLKKKEAASGLPSNQDELAGPEGEATELEKSEIVEDTVETPVQVKPKEETATIRSRNRTKARDSLPKIIAKRKKSNKYWMWAAAAISLLLTLFISLSFLKW